MAKQLYDYWFVQFDFPNEEGKPYKSSGGAMVWNEKLKREIPEGWNVMSINEICTSCRGVSYGKDDLLSNSNGVLVLRGNNIENNHIVYDSNVAFVPYDFVSEEQHIKEGDIIMTMSSGSKAHVGKCAMFHKDSEHTFGAFLSKFTPKKELRYMTFLFLTSEYFKSLITAFCNGTGINNLTNQTFDDVLLVLPDEKKTRLFESKVNGLFAMIGNNEENERILIKQRDELLPLLMNGQASVNSDLAVSYIIYKDKNIRIMKENIIQAIVAEMQRDLDCRQVARLKAVLTSELHNVEIIEKNDCATQQTQENEHLLNSFISAKKIEGCSDKTLAYYRNTIERLLVTLSLAICHISTTDIRSYLSDYQEEHQSSKVTIDNMRRIFSSFFAWLEDEDYIAKSPVRRIHKVKTDSLVKEVLSDEQLEQLRDCCTNKRDLAIIDILASTGIRVGELVKLNREDIDFHERQCVVFGKGNKERVVYFNARTKLHLQQYLNERTDDNPALFVSLNSPHSRLTISGVEVRIRKLGQSLSMPKVHPHKFRRTLATMAIDKGMPIEQVQRLLGHVRIDTTLHYAIVNQNNVKLAHKKYLG